METSLFNHSPQKSLAELLRPKNLDEFTGQEEILGPGKTLRTLIEKDKITSLIFYGPPGTGKTTLARIVSQMTQSDFVEVNATDSSVKEIREVCKKAGEKRRIYNKKTILFIDEVHRFNKAQQDVLLPFLEQREVIFIGSTTFNPFFYITPALNSRTLLFEFKKLEEKHLKKVLQRAFEGKVFQLSEEAENYLISISNGDARVLLNRLEILFSLKEDEQTIEKEELKEIFQTRSFSYERSDDHYDVISAFIKSVRGSDPDAALFYLAVMIEGGEDPRFIARRLAILAAEDIGLAEPGALAVVAGGFDLVEKIGLPEARIILSEMTVYLSLLPKSNSAYSAIDEAIASIKANPIFDIPPYLKDSHSSGAKKLERGKGYLYPHDYPNHFIEQDYTVKKHQFYHPAMSGRERNLNETLDKIKNRSPKNSSHSE